MSREDLAVDYCSFTSGAALAAVDAAGLASRELPPVLELDAVLPGSCVAFQRDDDEAGPANDGRILLRERSCVCVCVCLRYDEICRASDEEQAHKYRRAQQKADSN